MSNTLLPTVRCCAITFIGNASNKQQQDALFFLNDTIDEQAQADGRVADFESYNATGMASMLNTLTQYFVFNAQNNDAFDDIPNGSTQSITVTSGDSMLICTDGIYDLVPSDEWHFIDKNTHLKNWLRALKKQVYDSEGNAYDNGTAIVARFE